MRFAGLQAGLFASDFDGARESAQIINKAARFRRNAAPDPAARDFLGVRRIELAAFRDLGGEVSVELADDCVQLGKFSAVKRARHREGVADGVSLDGLDSDAQVLEQIAQAEFRIDDAYRTGDG